MNETQRQKRTTLPRRANTIREVASTLADIRLRIVTARQVISDRIGYIVASILGAATYHYFGRIGLAVLCALYAVRVVNAYHAWKELDRITK